MKLAALGEFALIERIRRAAPSGPQVRLGIGDDCAAQQLAPGELLLTSTDLLIEGVHFRRDWTDLRSLGRKSVSVNVSDIAAMGGEPRTLFLAVGLPGEMSVEEVDDFAEGFLEAASDYGAVLAGGDTCRSPGPFFISVTVQGAVPADEMVVRGGARPGDGIYVSGSLGDSALALQRLLAGEAPPPALASRHHDPRARTGLGRALAGERIPSAMIDLSDGLVADLGHILESSAAGGEVQAADLPLSPIFRTALEKDAGLLELALSGGEDYELLFTAAPQKQGEIDAIAAREGIAVTRIGTIGPPEGGFTIRGTDGRPIAAERRGFNHFAGEAPV